MDRGYCYEPCKKQRWYCCWDCLRYKVCVIEAQDKSKQSMSGINYVPCRKKKEECSIYHK